MKTILAQRYQLEACLGQATSTSAYSGIQVATKQPCLVLFLRLPYGLSQSARSRFFHRFDELTERLEALPAHPALISLLDAGVWRDFPYMVFPEVALAPTLLSMLTLPLDFKQAVTLVQAVAFAMRHAHAHDLVHGNLGLSSLISAVPDADTPVCLAGLGLRALLEAQGLEHVNMPYAILRGLWGTYLGDPSTQAPECVFGQLPDRRSDIYALGALLLQLLTPSADGKSSVPYLRAAIKGVYQPFSVPANLPDSLARLLARLIAFKPRYRWECMQEVVNQCRACLEEIEVLEGEAKVEKTVSC